MAKYRGWVGDPTWLVDVLRAEGVPIRVMPGAMGHGHGDFRSVLGSMWHHTGHDGTSAQYCFNGRIDLPGPICNLHQDRNGAFSLVGIGTAYHAGRGWWKWLASGTGNDHTIGVEMQEDGNGWPAAMWPNAVKAAAAISRALGRSADDSVVAHKEYGRVQGKPDPANWDMNEFRRQVQARIDGVNPNPMHPTDAPEGWTLPTGYYYGPLDGPEASISGMFDEPAKWMDGLRAWQKAVRITASGVYDQATRDAAIALQKRQGYKPDGLIGHGTFAAAFNSIGDDVDLNTIVKSAVDGSKVKAKLWQFLMWMDARTFRIEADVKHLTEQVNRIAELLEGRK